MRIWLPFVLVCGAAACGDDGGSTTPADSSTTPDATPDADTRDFETKLADLGWEITLVPCQFDQTARCYWLGVPQPVDHANPDGPKFTQRVFLTHHGEDLPMVALTSGYWDFYMDYPFELTALLGANQISIEHRFFAESRPTGATDWTQLTIENSARDQHEIVSKLRTIYKKAWLTTGASKGGMTASYHRRFFPNDVEGTVPYVAPLSLAPGDTRYATFMDELPTACRDALRAVAVNLLGNTRFEAMVTRAQSLAQQQGMTFNRVALRPAVESAITGIEWAFWQYTGVTRCNEVPPTNATDNTMFAFLANVSGITSDADLDLFDAYYYQAAYELGYPDGGEADYTTGLTRHGGTDYDGAFPQGQAVPAYRPEAMMDIDSWIKTEASRFVFVYGEYDPWTGGKYSLGAATDSQLSIAPQATHGAGLVDLPTADKMAAYDRIEAWAGVRPNEARLVAKARAPKLAPPRIPPPVLRALQLRR